MISIIPFIYSISYVDIFGEYSLVKEITGVGAQGSPQYITLDLDNRFFYISVYGSSGEIVVINARTNNIEYSIPLGQNSAHYVSDLIYNPITQKVYVLNSGFNSTEFFNQVSVIDPLTRQVVDIIPIGEIPGKITVDPISGTMYATSLGSNEVYVINTSHSIVDTISIPIPYGITYNLDRNLVYVTSYEFNSNNGHVYVIDPTTSSVVEIITVGNLPAQGIDYNPTTDKVYVSNIRSSSISVIDGSTNKLINDIPVGAFPAEIMHNSYDGNMYVTNLNSQSISVINSENDSIKDNIQSLGVYDIEVDTSTGFIYLTSHSDFSVYVIKEIKPSGTCPEENLKHWDKIIFKITSRALATTLNLPLNSELDIKIQDSPVDVVDIKNEIALFLNIPASTQNRNSLEVVDVDYDIACKPSEPIGKKSLDSLSMTNQSQVFFPSENLTATTLG